MENNLPDILDAELLSPGMLQVMKGAGISVKELVEHGKKGLNATKTRYDRDGDEIENVPDWNIRHKYWSGFCEIFKLVHGTGTTVNVQQILENKEEEEEYRRNRCVNG